MSLRVVGAGVGRTGTLSLKLALERLLGEPCYHMMEVFNHPDHVPMWHAAAVGDPPDWDRLFDGYVAGVDWPVGAFWRELMAAYPDALVLLSTRKDAATWFRSGSDTIFKHLDGPVPEGMEEWRAMVEAMFRRNFGDIALGDAAAMTAAYERHNADVRAGVPADRLLDWQPGDGWEPICTALDLPVPDEPFPHVNTTEEFNARRDD